ncbi:hypothetical protein S245_026193, partial [Arachis hypogaea]
MDTMRNDKGSGDHQRNITTKLCDDIAITSPSPTNLPASSDPAAEVIIKSQLEEVEDGDRLVNSEIILNAWSYGNSKHNQLNLVTYQSNKGDIESMTDFVGYEVSNEVDSEMTISWEYGCKPNRPGKGVMMYDVIKPKKGPLNKLRCYYMDLGHEGLRPGSLLHAGGEDVLHGPAEERGPVLGQTCTRSAMQNAYWGSDRQQGFPYPVEEASMPGAFSELGAAASENGTERTSPHEDRSKVAVSRAVNQVERRSGDGCWPIEDGVTWRKRRHTGQGLVAKATAIVGQAEDVLISPSAETDFGGDDTNNKARRRRCMVGVGGGRLAVHGRGVNDLLRAVGAANNAEKGSSEVDADNGEDDQECDKSGLGTKAGTGRNLAMLEAGHRVDEEDVEH